MLHYLILAFRRLWVESVGSIGNVLGDFSAQLISLIQLQPPAAMHLADINPLQASDVFGVDLFLIALERVAAAAASENVG